MLAAFSLVADGLIVQRAAAPIAAPSAASRTTIPCAGLFDMFKESPEAKAAKEAEWKAIQEAQRRRLDPSAMDEYKDAVEERRLAQMAQRKAEENKLTSGEYEVVGAAKAAEPELPPNWTAVKDGEGDTYYVRSRPCTLVTIFAVRNSPRHALMTPRFVPLPCARSGIRRRASRSGRCRARRCWQM